jgi:UDP-GlcNAc3NAcA epimerase
MPEEINRILTDHVSEVLFAPTEIAVKNLANEGIASSKVSLVGDVMYDAAIFYKERAQPPIWADEIGIGSGDFVLCTIHRAENTSNHETLRGIMRGLEASNMHIVIPMHPRTRQVMRDAGVIVPQNVSIVPPVGYLEMVWLEMRCTLVATDSGGVQKEAYFHGKPCLTLREETEWVELVETGWNLLVGSDQEKISDALLSFRPSQGSTLLYGNGDSALKITEKLLGL